MSTISFLVLWCAAAYPGDSKEAFLKQSYCELNARICVRRSKNESPEEHKEYTLQCLKAELGSNR